MSKMDGITICWREVIEQPRNERERWLVNTVATRARQAGIAMPRKWLSTMRRTSMLLQLVRAVMPLWLLSAPVCCRT